MDRLDQMAHQAMLVAEAQAAKRDQPVTRARLVTPDEMVRIVLELIYLFIYYASPYLAGVSDQVTSISTS